MHLKNERKIGVILSYLSIIISTIVQLLYTPLLINKLGQSEFGLYSLVASIIGYLTVLDLGFGNAIIVYTAKYKEQGKKSEEEMLHGMFKRIFRIIAIVVSILGLLLYINVDSIFGNSMTIIELKKIKVMMLILTFNLFMTFCFSIYSSIITAYEKFIFQKTMAIVNTLLKPTLMIPLLFLGYKSITMTIIITIVNMFVLLMNYYYCKYKIGINIKYNGFDKKLFKVILGYSIWIFLAVIVDKVNWSVDNFILGAICGTAAVSIYSIAATLNTLFINLSTAISGVFLPKISKLIAKNTSNEVLTKEMIKVGRIQYYIIFLMCSGLILFGENFIILWAGKDYRESYYVALLLIIPVCIPLIQNLGLSIMQAMNKYKFKAISTSIMAIINVIISIFFAQKWGAIGAALGTCIGLIICNIIIINIYYYKSLKLNIIHFWKEITKQTIFFFIPVICILIIMNYTKLTGLVSFITYGSIYTILFCVTSYLLVMNKYEKGIINAALRKMRVKRVNNENNN